MSSMARVKKFFIKKALKNPGSRSTGWNLKKPFLGMILSTRGVLAVDGNTLELVLIAATLRVPMRRSD